MNGMSVFSKRGVARLQGACFGRALQWPDISGSQHADPVPPAATQNTAPDAVDATQTGTTQTGNHAC